MSVSKLAFTSTRPWNRVYASGFDYDTIELDSPSGQPSKLLSPDSSSVSRDGGQDPSDHYHDRMRAVRDICMRRLRLWIYNLQMQ